MKVQINNILPIIDLGKRVDQTLFVVSQARSGSTFFANLLNHKRDFRVLFEPLHKSYVERAQEVDLPLSLPEDDNTVEYKKFFADIIKGNISNKWIDRENKAGIYSKRLVKLVRANMLLPWIVTNFPDLKVIFLLRNPISVIESWERLNFGNGHDLREMVLLNEDVVKFIPDGLLKTYREEDDAFLLSVYYWCIYNSYPLKRCRSNSFICVKYEDVVERDQTVMEDIFKFTGIKISDLDEKHYSKTSSSSRKQRDSLQVALNKSKEKLGKERLIKAQHIIDLFEMNHLYNLL